MNAADASLDDAAVAALVAKDLALPLRGVSAVIGLLSGGATVPFIARYRKEVTGSLDEVQIRAIDERRTAVVELDERKQSVIASIREQGLLTPALLAQLSAATTKQLVEDLYLPFKPKRRTRALIARERGLEPLAKRILAQPRDGDAVKEARAFVDAGKDVSDEEVALAGARDIVAEVIADDASHRGLVRDALSRDGTIATKLKKKQTDKSEKTKFDGYADHQEAVARMPSHRVLAILRGEEEGVLKVAFDVDATRLLPQLESRARLVRGSPFARQLGLAIDDAFHRLLLPSVENEVRATLKERADRDAIEVFKENLTGVLLAAPLGAKPVIGIDPGIRTGCKCAVVDGSGRFVESVTIFPGQGTKNDAEAKTTLAALVKKHAPTAIAVGNGTAGRETEAFARAVVGSAVVVVAVNESGASVYSASDIARDEFPDIDLTVRGAISIARRLQDPLAELVKVDPKAIGVGQYQHDVDQKALQQKLDDVIESCVNRVGVDLNTASAPLLAHVAGIGPKLAKNIVQHREQHGVFASRKALLDVKGLGDRTFEQAAGFLRVRAPTSTAAAPTKKQAHPLDASGVHPERYALVEQMAKDLGTDVKALVGNAELVKRIDITRYRSTDVGDPTLKDIVAELARPGRDPRQSFEPPRFRDDVRELKDLVVGMELEGVVTNVTAFGAFVDIGVHQDGLVHISQLADRFVQNPHDVVKAGDRARVRVLGVDLQLKRVSLKRL